MADMETKKKCAASTDTARPSTEDNGEDNHQTGKPTAEIKFHPIAEIFPLMKGAELDVLVADIGANGLHDAITTHEGKILDGRNRYLACLKAGVPPRSAEFKGDDPIGFVIGKNVHRRQLDDNQREIVAAKLAALPPGRPSVKSGQLAGLTQADAAKLLNVNERAVRRAGDVLKHGVPELQLAVTSGKVSISAAAAVAVANQKKPDRQLEILARGPEGVAAAAKKIRAHAANSKTRKAADTMHGPARSKTDAMPASTSFRSTEEQTEALTKHIASIGHDIDPTDLIIAPGSNSAKARPSEYAVIRIPHSHPDRETLKRTIRGFRDAYNTQVFFKDFPQGSNGTAGEGAGDEDVEAGDDD
jgi:ParB-like chromosome segregation protein Spo0J